MEKTISSITAIQWDRLRSAIAAGLSNEFGFNYDKDDELRYEEDNTIQVACWSPGGGPWSAEVLGYRLDDFGLPVVIVYDEDEDETFEYDERTLFYGESIEHMVQSIEETFCGGTPINYERDDYVFLVESGETLEVFSTRAAALTFVRSEIMRECEANKHAYKAHKFDFYTYDKGKVVTHFSVTPKRLKH